MTLRWEEAQLYKFKQFCVRLATDGSLHPEVPGIKCWVKVLETYLPPICIQFPVLNTTVSKGSTCHFQAGLAEEMN